MSDGDMALPWTLPPHSSTNLLVRYELKAAEITQRTESIGSRARAVAMAVADASARAKHAAAAWGQLRAELQMLPQSVGLVHELAASVTAACAQIYALEHRLHDAALACAEQDEGRWRKRQLEALDLEQRQREAERQERAAQAADAAAAVQRAREREREQIFQAQFEREREYLCQHGELETLALRRREAERQPQPPAAGPFALEDPPGSLADVTPCAGEVAELDDFYGDDDG